MAWSDPKSEFENYGGKGEEKYEGDIFRLTITTYRKQVDSFNFAGRNPAKSCTRPAHFSPGILAHFRIEPNGHTLSVQEKRRGEKLNKAKEDKGIKSRKRENENCIE